MNAYTPDWAVFLHEYGADKFYLVVEIKESTFETQRRVIENEKFAALMYFKSINEVDYKEAFAWHEAKPAAQMAEKVVA